MALIRDKLAILAKRNFIPIKYLSTSGKISICNITPSFMGAIRDKALSSRNCTKHPNPLLQSRPVYYFQFQAMSTCEKTKPLASFEEVKKAGSDNKVLIVDVREPTELAETGVIPASINIPLGDVENVLKNMSDDEFQQKFSRNKPDKSAPIIFSCRLGRRSETAQDIALKLGFNNVRNYLGGWLEWEEKIKNC